MFNWLGNIFPYSDLHSLNLDWILSKMKETAAQAAKAIADSANALAQVIEAKTAAQNAQTAAQNAQTAANNAADSAENAVAVAQSAQTTAHNAQTAAQNAQTAAQNANTTATTAINKFPIGTDDILDGAIAKDKIANNAVTKDKIADLSINTNKLASNSVTKSKLGYDVVFYVGVGSYGTSNTKTPSQIAAGMATFNFQRSQAAAEIFVVNDSATYTSEGVTHYLNTYSDPFVLFRQNSVLEVKITLSDYNPQTGTSTLYPGTLKITISNATVTCLFTFDETLPLGDNVKVPYGITGLSAAPTR